MGVGVVVRDYKGRVEAALSKKLHLPLGPLGTEAKAMEEGVHFAWEVGVLDIMFKSDSKIVIDVLNGVSEAPVAIDNIIGGIRVKMQYVKRVSFSLVKRKGNRPAHLWA